MTGLARSTDPQTSHDAERSLDLLWTTEHESALRIYSYMGPMTDIQAAEELCKIWLFSDSMETNRRLIRTIRENHGRLVPALDAEGNQIQSKNPSGRWALCWKPGHGTPREAPKKETYVKLRAVACKTENKFCAPDCSRECDTAELFIREVS